MEEVEEKMKKKKKKKSEIRQKRRQKEFLLEVGRSTRGKKMKKRVMNSHLLYTKITIYYALSSLVIL